MGDAKVISVDSHIVEPGDLWTSYIDPKFRDRAPRLVRRPDTGDTWQVEGLRLPNIGRMGMAGLRTEDVPPDPIFEENVRPGAWEQKARLEDMAVDGSDAHFLYPTVGFQLYGLEDLDFLYACLEAWNRWIADWCKEYEDHFRGIGFVLLDDIERGIQEMIECERMGLPGVCIPTIPAGPPYSDEFYDSFWATAQEMGMPISTHGGNRGVNAQGKRGFQPPGSPRDVVGNATVGPDVQQFIAELIAYGVFERFPRLNVIPVEREAGWAAYLIQRLDDRFYSNRGSAGFQFVKRQELKPSEYFRRNVMLTVTFDELAVRCRDLIGVDNLMWIDDYPHIDGTWPESGEVHERLFPKGEVSEEDKAKILGGNAARVYDCFR